MGIYNLDRLFAPRTIAVVGASEKAHSIGGALMTNLRDGGFAGEIFPVNPNHETIHGRQAFKDLTAVEASIDLAVIATPIATVPDIIDQCAGAGVGAAVVISAGGREAGDQGRRLEDQIQKKAYQANLRVVGPNCLGIIRPGDHLNASFAPGMPLAGNLGFVSQSGAICTAMLDLSAKERIGFSHFVSIGSMLDVDFGDMIDYLGNDPDTRSILLYIESLTHVRKFMSAARAVSRIKPIVVLKAGRSDAGARAASSHTGALAGADAVYDAAFQRAGIVRVDTIEQLFDCAELMAKRPRPAGSRLAIVTNGGGPGVIATDVLAHYDLEPAPLPSELREKLDDILPPHWSGSNPIDILGDATEERFARTIDLCVHSRAFDGLLAIMAPQALTDSTPVAEALAALGRNVRFPLFASWIGGDRMRAAVEALNRSEIPTYEAPERAIQAFRFMLEYNRNLEMLTQTPPRLARDLESDRDHVADLIRQHLNADTGFLTEAASKQILAAYGIAVNRTETASSADEAVAAAEQIGYPVALKLLSTEISHKTDADGVHLDLGASDAVRQAYEKILRGAEKAAPEAAVAGVSVQAYIHQPDYELLIGAKTDQAFGPVLLFGLGGIFTEIVEDRALALPPLNRLLAHRLMERTRAYRLLQGYRNRPPADLEALEELLIRLAHLVTDFPQIVELDLNPVIVKDGRPCVVDARIKLAASDAEAPLHLVISPYPEAYEFIERRDGDREFLIRPIKPEDAPLFQELFESLSQASIYYRFFSAIKTLSSDMLARFTQIDYDRQIALVALDRQAQADQMLGVARVIGDPDGRTGEFSVLVGDPWQGQGIGGRLLGRVLQIAQQRSMETVWGVVLKENRGMLALAEKLGFEAQPGADAGEMEMKIELGGVDFAFLDESKPAP